VTEKVGYRKRCGVDVMGGSTGRNTMQSSEVLEQGHVTFSRGQNIFRTMALRTQ
jgi:hypothetical protein